MAQFKFELEAVLRQRLRAEQNQQRVVAALERERIEIENEIRSCQVGIEQERQDLSARLAAERQGRVETGVRQGVDFANVRVQANASLHLVAQTQRSVLRLSGVMVRIDRERLTLLERTKERRAMEILRDRRKERWEQEQARREAAALDELAVMRHGFGGAGVSGSTDSGAAQ